MYEALATPPPCLSEEDPQLPSVVEIRIIAEAKAVPARETSDRGLPDESGRPVASSRSNEITPSRRSRTRSLEIGARAKEVIKDIRGLGRSAATDRNDGNMQAGSIALQIKASSTRVAWPVHSSSSPQSARTKSYAARQVYILDPLASEKRHHTQASSAAAAVPCTSSYLETRIASAGWEKKGKLAIEYATMQSNLNNARAGNLHPSSTADDPSEVVAVSSKRKETSMADLYTSRETQLSLKVTPPVRYCHQITHNDSISSSSISVKARIRVPMMAATFSTTKRTSPAGPRKLKTESHDAIQAQGAKKIVFVSTYSSEKLYNAMNDEYPLVSPQAARLEGIDWLSIDTHVTNDTDLIDFDWTWREISRDGTAQVDALGNRNIDCACAFIEVSRSEALQVLATFHFTIVQQTVPQVHFPILSSPQLPFPSTSGTKAMQAESVPSASSHFFSSDPFILDTSSAVGTSQCFDLSCTNRVSLELEDIEEDGPMLRAAIQDVEKKTVNLSKAAKVVIKAAAEVRECLGQLQAARMTLDVAFEGTSSLMPSTIGYLHHTLLQPEQSKSKRKLEEENILLRDHVEAPLLQVLDQCKMVHQQLKVFEMESKEYYAGTQKWLASKAATSSTSRKRLSSGQTEAELYSPAAIGFDKSSVKQEKLDCDQRIRQLRFYMARLTIFRVMNLIQGGELELQLARHTLTMCQWHCQGNSSALKGIDQLQRGFDTEAATIQERDNAISVRQSKAEEHLFKLSQSNGSGTLGYESDVSALTSREIDLNKDIAKKRMMQAKAKLSSLGGQRGSTIDTITSKDPNHSLAANHFPQTPVRDASRTRRPQSMVIDATKMTPASAVHSQQSSFGTPTSSSHSQERSVSDPISSPFPTSRAPCRTAHNQALARSPPLSSSDYYCAKSNGFDMHRRSSQGSPSRRVSMPSQCARVEEIMAPPPPPSRISLLQPRGAAQFSRKKEGVLWAMSRSIAGPGGDDAPKALSKSQNWKESWVVLSGSGHLGQYADWKNVNLMEPSQPLIDLRFATVRPSRNVDRRFTFEVVTKDCRRFFQAANEEEMSDWIGAISLAIESLINGTSSIRQTEKVAKKAREQSPFIRPGDDFGPHTYSSKQGGLGQHREFSQSLTDLSNMTNSGPSRLFHRKRDSKSGDGHLMTLSEGAPSKGPGSGLWSFANERGISNKTPLSGYLARSESVQSSSTNRSQGDSDAQHEYDRRIEEMIQSSYGATTSSTKTDASSEMPTRQVIEDISKRDGLQSPRDKYTRYKELCDIINRPENRHCADCRAENPKWASWALNGEPQCIFICIACSGIHRSLGVGVCKVKSVDLDDWTEEQIDSARNWGNLIVNAVYEATKPLDVVLDVENHSRDRSFYIRKYVDKEWYRASEKVQEDATNANAAADEESERATSPLLDEKWNGQLSSLKSMNSNAVFQRIYVEREAYRKDQGDGKVDTAISYQAGTPLSKASNRISAHRISHCSPVRSIGVNS